MSGNVLHNIIQNVSWAKQSTLWNCIIVNSYLWHLVIVVCSPQHPKQTRKMANFLNWKWVRIGSRHLVIWMKLNPIKKSYKSMACKNFWKSWPKFEKEEYRRWTTGKEQPDPKVRPEGREAEVWRLESKQREGVACRTQHIYEALWFLGKDRWQKGLDDSGDS